MTPILGSFSSSSSSSAVAVESSLVRVSTIACKSVMMKLASFRLDREVPPLSSNVFLREGRNKAVLKIRKSDHLSFSVCPPVSLPVHMSFCLSPSICFFLSAYSFASFCPSACYLKSISLSLSIILSLWLSRAVRSSMSVYLSDLSRTRANCRALSLSVRLSQSLNKRPKSPNKATQR